MVLIVLGFQWFHITDEDDQKLLMEIFMSVDDNERMIDRDEEFNNDQFNGRHLRDPNNP